MCEKNYSCEGYPCTCNDKKCGCNEHKTCEDEEIKVIENRRVSICLNLTTPHKKSTKSHETQYEEPHTSPLLCSFQKARVIQIVKDAEQQCSNCCRPNVENKIYEKRIMTSIIKTPEFEEKETITDVSKPELNKNVVEVSQREEMICALETTIDVAIMESSNNEKREIITEVLGVEKCIMKASENEKNQTENVTKISQLEKNTESLGYKENISEEPNLIKQESIENSTNTKNDEMQEIMASSIKLKKANSTCFVVNKLTANNKTGRSMNSIPFLSNSNYTKEEWDRFGLFIAAECASMNKEDSNQFKKRCLELILEYQPKS